MEPSFSVFFVPPRCAFVSAALQATDIFSWVDYFDSSLAAHLARSSRLIFTL